MAIVAASAEDVSGIVELAPLGTAGRTVEAAWSSEDEAPMVVLKSDARIEERAVVTEAVVVSPHSLLQSVLALLVEEPLTEIATWSPAAWPTANLRAISPPPRANTMLPVR